MPRWMSKCWKWKRVKLICGHVINTRYWKYLKRYDCWDCGEQRVKAPLPRGPGRTPCRAAECAHSACVMKRHRPCRAGVKPKNE